MSLVQDRGGLLWVGIRIAGASRWNPRSWSFGHRTPAPLGIEDASSRLVTSFAERRDGRVLVGTMGAGIRVLDLAGGRADPIHAGPRSPHGLSDDRVMALLCDGQGTLWAGTMNGGLNRLDTGLRNRRSFAEQIGHEIALVRRRYQERADGDEASDALDLVFMKIDLDGFRGLSDSYGATVGDRLLADVGGVLQSACRASDLLFRWQDDEFVLVARNTDPERAERLAERLRSRIAGRTFRCGGHELELTCSLGFTSYPFPRQRPGRHADEAVLALADHALLEAKQHGDAWVGLVAGAASDAAGEAVARISLEEPEMMVEKGLLEVRRSVTDAAA